MTLYHHFQHFLKQIDTPGALVSLSYKQQRNFSTSIGGAITLVAKLGILSFFLSLASNIANYSKTIALKSVFKGANTSNQTTLLDFDNFDVAIGVNFVDGLSHIYEKQNLHRFVRLEYSHV